MATRDKRKKKKLQKVKSKEAHRQDLLGKIRTFDDPILHTMCTRVINHNAGVILGNEMMRVLKATETGVGLAAPQIGETLRVMVINYQDTECIYINPEIKAVSVETISGTEGCLSFPGVTTNIDRPKSILLSYTDVDGEDQTVEMSDFLARIADHEIDHLNGVCEVGEEWEKRNEG